MNAKMNAKCRSLACCALVVTSLMVVAPSVAGQGTAFTYQGRLAENGNPANGSYDLQFYLRDALAAGNPVGATNTLAPVAVNSGLFTVTLDFGANIFDGSARWLEIGVRTNGSAAAYTTLAPRQQITSTPYAVRSLGATSADTARTATSVAWTNLVGQPSGYLAGAGLTLSTSIFSDQFKVFSVDFALPTDGSESTVPRSDHRHYGQKWNGSAEAGLEIHTDSTSPGAAGLIGQVTGPTPGNLSAGVRGISEGPGSPGIGVYGSQDGSGWGVYGTSRSGNGVYGLATQDPGSGVRGEANASGAFGVYGRSTSGTGVRGLTDTGRAVDGFASNGGVGVYGNNLGSNTKGYAAYFFGRVGVTGAIQVPGAGVDTSTPVFIQKATASNVNGIGTIIDHPLCNGDPDAILIVTPNWYNSYTGYAGGIGVSYQTALGNKWVILHTDSSAMHVNEAFNVLVIKP
jgi:hypothetical protein